MHSIQRKYPTLSFCCSPWLKYVVRLLHALELLLTFQAKPDLKGAFNNYVDRILPFFDPPPLCVDSFHTLSVDKNRYFLTLSPSFLVHVSWDCPFLFWG